MITPRDTPLRAMLRHCFHFSPLLMIIIDAAAAIRHYYFDARTLRDSLLHMRQRAAIIDMPFSMLAMAHYEMLIRRCALRATPLLSAMMPLARCFIFDADAADLALMPPP
jgi:hypothetical protein